MNLAPMRRETRVVLGARARSFDVICAGEALWKLTAPGGALFTKSAALRFRPGGGAVHAALALAQAGLRVGLATALGDDTFGRALLDRIAAAGVDVSGVTLAPPRTGLVFVEGTGTARQVVSYREEEPPVAVPAGWSSQVLLLSGLSPVLSHGAAVCKAARAARRAGSIVVVDVNARQHLWAGHDQRAIRMVLREADVVRCSAADLAVLGVDAATVRAALRKTAVLVVSNGTGDAWATGPFGEVAQAPRATAALRPMGAGDLFTAAICAELAHAGNAGESRIELCGSERSSAATRRRARGPRGAEPSGSAASVIRRGSSAAALARSGDSAPGSRSRSRPPPARSARGPCG
jgi:2-dehydro-3-deoxygluconokinase